MMHVQAAGLTDVGRKRDGNEDALLVNHDKNIYVVADGMGGHLAGEVASGIVVDTFARCMANGAGMETDAPPLDDTLSPAGNRLLACIREANSRVFEKSQSDAACRGMGSTVAALHCTGSTIVVANVGDSPIYLIREGEPELVSVIHTVAAEQAATDPAKLQNIAEKFLHMLSRAIGVARDVKPDICETDCFPGDIVVLCSDGLSNLVAPGEIADVAVNRVPEAACRELIDLANDRGGTDNITVIVVRMEGDVQRHKGLRGVLMKVLGALRLPTH